MESQIIKNKLKSTRSTLLILGLSFIVIHIFINLIQSGLDDFQAYIGWNLIRTYIFVGSSVIFFFKWKRLTKYEKMLMNTN